MAHDEQHARWFRRSALGTVMGYLINRPDRRFKMWQYSVSMARLLLRSNKDDGAGSRIDVMFQDVHALKLPTLLDGLVIAEADSEQSGRAARETGVVLDRGTVVYSVRGLAYDGYVVAGVCVHVEDEGEFFEPSQLWPGL